MLSLVIVSHSLKLAEGVRELTEQMTGGQVPLALAAGLDDPANPIGTDALKVAAAIESVYHPDGVIVVMDLGSALLSAEAALDFLDPEWRPHVHLCPGPLVEGTVAAAMQAVIGATVEEALAEASRALTPKLSHLGEAASALPHPVSSPREVPHQLRVTVRNRLGLHARPAANLVKTGSPFQSEIHLHKGDQIANLRSINQVATLGVRTGEEIMFTATGPDAAEALSAVKTLADRNFGEAEGQGQAGTAAPGVAAVSRGNELAGRPASPGIAIGPAVHYRIKLPDVPRSKAADAEKEWARFQAALAPAKQELNMDQARTARQAGASEAAIFEVHQLILEDPVLTGAMHGLIFQEQLSAEAAWIEAIDTLAGEYLALPSELLRLRAADILDIGRRVLQHLLPLAPDAPREWTEPSILIARDLAPSVIARLNPKLVQGICTELGGASSHAAILARAMGIPVVAGVPALTQLVAEGQVIGLDGDSGRVYPRPDENTIASLQARQLAWRKAQEETRGQARQPSATRDGTLIEIAANVAGPPDSAAALESGADGIGLFRTEFLFLERSLPPGEDEQMTFYRQVFEHMDQRPIVVRTLDLGGDKIPQYREFGLEPNPFLGRRGLRLCLESPAMFKTQLRAILRAASGHQVSLMFPMVANLEELRAAKKLLHEAASELKAEALSFLETMKIGVMIEVPSAAILAGAFAREVDFFSIGSNDLAQYVMAADRVNDTVAHLASALQPAVLHLIRQTVRAADASGIPVGLCGEVAGNPRVLPLLTGLGLRSFSISAPNIPPAKEAVRRISLQDARNLADEALALDSAEAVQARLDS